MARKPDVQYICLYTDGSAARKVASAFSVQPATTLPKIKKKKCKRIYIDPVATLGIVVAVCMLVLMAVGIARFASVQQQNRTMEQYVAQLENKNMSLSQEYTSGYDLEEVEKTALALGMVPNDSVQRIVIKVPTEQPERTEQTVTLWEHIGIFLTRLFA